MKLSHAEAQALISARLDGPLDPVAERELTAHLATCESCRAFNASTTQLARGLQSLPYLPASPAVARAVLDHVSTPRSPLTWLTGSLPPNALPAASAIAAAVIVVFVGSFAAFRFLDAEDEPSTIPASTLSVTDLAQRSTEMAEAEGLPTERVESIAAPTEGTEGVEGQSVVTEEPDVFAETAVVTDTPVEPTTEPVMGGDPTAESSDPFETEIGPPPGSDAQRQPPTEASALDPTSEPAADPAPTDEPIQEPPATLSASIRQALGLETAVPAEIPTSEPAEPTAEPTPSLTASAEPTAEPTATVEPTATAVPTEAPTATTEPTATATTEPTATATIEPTEEPAPTEAETEIPIVEPQAPPETESTEEPSPAPADEPTEEPTPIPATLEPTPEPTAEPAVASTATTVPIEPRDETPNDEASGSEETGEASGDIDPSADPEGSDEEDAPPGSDQIIDSVPQDADDDPDDGEGGEQVIEPSGGDDPATSDDPVETPDEGTGNAENEETASVVDDDGIGGGTSASLTNAEVSASVDAIPGDPTLRLGLSADGELIFSSNPGRVSLVENGISLETRQGPTGQVVEACDANGSCVDISSGSATSGGLTDTPIGWLGDEVIYERLNGDEFAVEFRAITLDPASLQPTSDRSIFGGGVDLTTFIRPYPVDGALLVPAPAGWLRISSSSVEIVDGNPYGTIDLIRIDQAAGRISYVSGDSLIVASIGSPGSPDTQIPFPGSDYDLSPDGSRVAVVTGSGIDILDTSGNVLVSYPNEEGIAIGSLTWLNQGLVFVDLTNGVLRIVEP